MDEQLNCDTEKIQREKLIDTILKLDKEWARKELNKLTTATLIKIANKD